jgi:ribosomal protein S18 acetylase RimI-like enzyme
MLAGPADLPRAFGWNRGSAPWRIRTTVDRSGPHIRRRFTGHASSCHQIGDAEVDRPRPTIEFSVRDRYGVHSNGSLMFRPATTADEDLLWQLLFNASRSNEEPGADISSLKRNPDLVRYVRDWGRAGDFGIVAESDTRLVAGAWSRLLVGQERNEPDYVDVDVPELAVAVLPGYEGQGIGTVLLSKLLNVVDAHFPASVLSVRQSNPAVSLYRFGFEIVEEMTNRLGGRSYKMLRRRPAD